jgi:lambda family phage tail tape measure protein
MNTEALKGFIPAANGATFSNGIAKFASGGVVSSPTLFKFADGGTTRTGLMGEAGPEAILPLSRGPGGKLGVMASGGGGGDVNVVVNVDASGSKVEGDAGQAKALGNAISAAVQSELIKQKRPGGLLA